MFYELQSMALTHVKLWVVGVRCNYLIFEFHKEFALVVWETKFDQEFDSVLLTVVGTNHLS
jgi:hypothetical protein